jgi:ABC-type glycerol-3-phosphate transport system substrate-binding protein
MKSLKLLSCLVVIGVLVAACAPQEPEVVERVVTKVVEETIVETRIVEGEPVEVTRVVTQEPPPEPAELDVWIYDSVAQSEAPQAPIYAAVEAFEEENPNIDVDLIPTQYGSTSFRDKFVTAAQAGAGPDVIMADIIWSPDFAAIGAAMPIDEYLPDGKLDEFYPGPITTLQWEGQTYGLPFYTNALGMFYNKDAFAEAGLDDPRDGWTWEDFSAAAETLTQGDMYGYGVLGGWGPTFEWFPFLWSNGGQVLSDDFSQAAFNDDAGLEAAEFFLGLINSPYVPEAAKTWKSWDELAAAFSNEVIAMYAVGDWGIKAVESMEPGFEWGVAPLPVAEEPASVVGGANLMINSNTEHPEAAYALIEYLTSDAVFQMMDGYNRLAARRGNMEQQEIVQNDPRMQVIVEALEYARARPPIPNWLVVDWECLQPAFLEVMLEGKEVSVALSEAATCANEALAE